MAAQSLLCGLQAAATVQFLFPSRKTLPVPLPSIVLLPRRRCGKIGVSGGDSYLGMWKKAVDRETKERDFRKIAENVGGEPGVGDEGMEKNPEEMERKSELFRKILEVPKEQRDRVQRLQVIDRAAAAIAAARALLKDNLPPEKPSSEDSTSIEPKPLVVQEYKGNGVLQGSQVGKSYKSQLGTPGSDFWSWSPPLDDDVKLKDDNIFQALQKPVSAPNLFKPLIEKEKTIDFLPIPFESVTSESRHHPPLPPLQSFVEVAKADAHTKLDLPSTEELQLDSIFLKNALDTVDALHKSDQSSLLGVNPDGSRWWKEAGIERRPDGVICKWTLTRGVNADGSVEWEDKFWEAADQFEYKELGSEKSGRDASGNVWREYWKESMWQDLENGIVHIEKTADKWGKNGNGTEWQEKWWEHYDDAGLADKWAHKWCSIDPNTLLEPGHAHVWNERWGERYDGQGSSMKYTDKWAERFEGDGWAKWGDKWDENFDSNGHGVKQGETWWEGKYGEQWNRTWGEQHNGSGWVHKYGRSSSGEHWDTHVEQDTWYERYPHYGFDLCLKNSVQLRQLQKPPETL